MLSVGPLIITTLKQYTSYSVRMAALNAVGVGQFSDSTTVHTQGIRKYCTKQSPNSSLMLCVINFGIQESF